MLEILYEDEALLVVWKPVGVESQSARGFSVDMVSEIRNYIHKTSQDRGNPYVGVIHRLDKPVSGVMVYAKNKKAAAELSRQVSNGEMHKTYLAVLCGKPVDTVENFVDYLLKDEKKNCSRVVDKQTPGAKRAELVCETRKVLETEDYGILTLARIRLLTGRHHQIRVQLSYHGLPLWGDNRYNLQFTGGAGGAGSSALNRVNIALSAIQLIFSHPVTGKQITVSRLPEGGIFSRFGLENQDY